jgi:hypothetical protein
MVSQGSRLDGMLWLRSIHLQLGRELEEGKGQTWAKRAQLSLMAPCSSLCSASSRHVEVEG